MTDWSAEVKSPVKQLSLSKEVIFELQDAAGDYLKFDGQNRVSSTGTVQRFSLNPNKPSITLRLKPGSYLISSQINGKSVPKRSFKTFGAGDYEFSVGVSGESASPAPDMPVYLESGLYASAKVSKIEGQRLQLESFPLPIDRTESTVYYLETSFSKDPDKPNVSDEPVSIGTVTADEFFAALKPGQALAVEGIPEAGVVKARSLVRLAEGSIGDSGYLSLNGKIASVNPLQKQLKLQEFEDFGSSFSAETGFYSEYETLDAATFWSRAVAGRQIMLDGLLSSQGFKVSYVYLPAIGDEIPPLPDYLEGEITELNAVNQSLRLNSNPDILIKGSSDTLYYHDRLGEVAAEQFWQKLSLGNYLYLEGYLEGTTLTATSIYLLVKPQAYLEGQIQRLDRNTRQIKLYGWDSTLIEVKVETTYSDNASAKALTADEFWKTIQKEDFVAVVGDFSRDGSVLEADEVIKTEQTLSYLAGTLLSSDKSLGKLVIGNEVTVDPSPPGTVTPNLGSDGSATQESSATQEIFVTDKTSFMLDYTKNINAAEFWSKLEPGMYFSVEGKYHNDRFESSVVYIGTYPVLDYLEGSVASFNQSQNSLSLVENPDLIISTQEASFYDETGSIRSTDFWSNVKKGSYIVAEGKKDDRFYAVSVFLYQDKPFPEPVPLETSDR
ncbi:MAG: hypothetical protein KC422_10745 [Trueperaceae bacterium]|nr:hypothetical protein [Trueperaceae bacterium]